MTKWTALAAAFAMGAAGSEAAELSVRAEESDKATSPLEQILEQSYDRDTLAAIIGHSSRGVRPRGNRRSERSSKAVDAAGMRRVERFQPLIDQYAQLRGLDPNLVKAVIYTESGGNPNAVSGKGAGGLMQIMPATAAELGVRDLFDPEDNIASGTRYLGALMEKFRSPELALWAYNAGPQSVARDRMPAETQRYVPKVMEVSRYLAKSEPASRQLPGGRPRQDPREN